MRRYIAYLRSVLRHKWFVLQECLEIGVPIWWAIIHDWDKFTPRTFISYAQAFYKPDGSKQYAPGVEFDYCWNFHQKINKHHWQYYVLIMDRGIIVPLPMPDRHRREMLADWRGAGRAYGNPDTRSWYLERREMFKKYIHSDTLDWLDQQLFVHISG